MLAEPGFWLIVAGGLVVAGSFIGLVFSRNRDEVHPVLDQMADDPVNLPAWFSTHKKAFGRATPQRKTRSPLKLEEVEKSAASLACRL